MKLFLEHATLLGLVTDCSEDHVPFISMSLVSTKQKNNSAEVDVEKLELLHLVGGSIKWYSCCGKLCFLKKLSIELPFDSAFPLLGIYTKVLKAGT